MEDKNKIESDSTPLEDAEQQQEMLRKSLIKTCIPIVLSLFILCCISVAWFAMNREVDATRMGVSAQGMPYTIQTRDSNGYYKKKWDKIGSDAIEWKVSATNNFDNHGQDLDYEEEEPGLEPGDSGVLEFRVNPNTSDSITVDCIFGVKAYVETVVKDEQGKARLDKDGNAATEITEISDDTLTGYLNAHLMLFSGYDSESGKYTGLIDNDQALRRVLANQTYTVGDDTYTKIYWVWPMHLEDITSNNNSRIIYASEERDAVIAYVARNKDGFFKDCNDDEQQVISDLTSLSIAYDNTIYNHYNIRYDNADLEIGNNISYVMLSMKVEE